MSKKLFAEVDKVLKDVRTFMESYDDKWQELRDFNRAQLGVKEKYWEEGRKEQMRGKKHAVRTATLELMDFKHVCDSKAKIETEMEGILRKLHRFRQQIIDWLGNIDLRSYRDELFDVRKQIELRYKRGKSFYKLGLSSDDCDDGERQKAEDTQSWINEFIQKLSSQADEFDADMDASRGELAKSLAKDAIRHSKKHQDKRQHKPVSHIKDKIDQLHAFAELHRLHIRKLEGILRHIRRHEILLTDNNIEELHETLLPYVDNNSDLTIVVAEEVYTELGLNFDQDLELENSPARLSSIPENPDNESLVPVASVSLLSSSVNALMASPDSSPRSTGLKVLALNSSTTSSRNVDDEAHEHLLIMQHSPPPKRRFGLPNSPPTFSPKTPLSLSPVKPVLRNISKGPRLEQSSVKPAVNRWAESSSDYGTDDHAVVASSGCAADVIGSAKDLRTAWPSSNSPRPSSPHNTMVRDTVTTTSPHVVISIEMSQSRWVPSAEGGDRHQMPIEPNETLNIVKRDPSGWTYGFVTLPIGGYKEGWFPNSVCLVSRPIPRRSSLVNNNGHLPDELSPRRKSFPAGPVCKVEASPVQSSLSADMSFTQDGNEITTPQSVISRCSTSPSPSLKHEPMGPKSVEALETSSQLPPAVNPTMVSNGLPSREIDAKSVKSTAPAGYAVIHVIPDQVQVHELQWTWNGELASETGTKLLRFQKGERVEVLLHNEAGWIFGRIRGEAQRQGWFPDYMLRSPDELLRSLLQELRQVGDEVIRPLAGVGSVANIPWTSFAPKNEFYKPWLEHNPWGLSRRSSLPFFALERLSSDKEQSLFAMSGDKL